MQGWTPDQARRCALSQYFLSSTKVSLMILIHMLLCRTNISLSEQYNLLKKSITLKTKEIYDIIVSSIMPLSVLLWYFRTRAWYKFTRIEGA